MLIRIEGTDLPGRECAGSPDSPGGYHNVHVAVQRRNRRDELLGLTPADATAATWTLECVPAPTSTGFDLKGRYIQGTPGARFIYLSWGVLDEANNFRLFRRAKLWLNCVPDSLIERAVAQGVLIGRLGLTGRGGNPLCAAVRPPLIDWSTASA